MCTTCGCGGDGATIGGKAHTHSHDHDHDRAPGVRRRVVLERDLLAKNNALAADNRAWFGERGLFVLNLVSSPGSGKTTLLVETIRRLQGRVPLAVIEGDQQTSRDAERILAAGAPAIQINTGKGCHLDAHMVGHAAADLDLAKGGVLLVENVGNLVCPAGFDLGEAHKVVILSVTEGEDKPLKYPDMFAAASVLVVNKVDLLPHLVFDVELCIANALRVNPALKVIRLSATTGENLGEWTDWILEGHAAVRA
jgi:hydrogenase nickel incorporation protein HypB